MKKRLLAGLLSLLMLAGMLPLTAMAEGTAASALSQTADNLDGDFISQVSMSFPSHAASGNMDLVFVLDGSTSSDQSNLAEYAAAMLEDLAKVPGLNIQAGLVIFGGTVPTLYQSSALVDTKDQAALDGLTAQLKDKSYDAATGRSGSNLQAGIEIARDLLAQGTAPAENKYMVLLTDGGARMWYDETEGVSVAKCYGGKTEVYFNTNQDYTDRYAAQPIRTFDQVIGQSGEVVAKYSVKLTDLPNVESTGEHYMDEDYYTNLESSTYFAAQSLMEMKQTGEAQVIWVDYPYSSGIFREYTDSFKSWLDQQGYVDRYDSTLLADPFAQVENSLLAALDDGSAVRNVIGYGTDNYGNAYDFEMVRLDQMKLTVGTAQYSAVALQQNQYGFGTPDSSGNYPFVVTYYPQGENGSSQECFLLSIHQALTGGETVTLDYQVQLTNPQSAAGNYGTYDRDGSQGKSSLLVSKQATLTPVDSKGNTGSEQPFPLPTVSYTVTDDSQKVQVNLTPLTVYVGGDGYEGVVTDNQGNVAGVRENTLPEPGYTIQLPQALDKALKQAVGAGENDTLDLSQYLRFTYDDGQETRVWTLELYDQNEGNTSIVDGKYLYRLVSAQGQSPIRLQFTDQNGNFMLSDDFAVDQNHPNQSYNMSIYPGALNQGLVKGEITLPGGQEPYSYSLQLGQAELKIRGVVSEEENPTTAIVSDVPQAAVGEMTAQLPQDTRYYYKNEQDQASPIQVADGSAVRLLVDQVIPSATQALEKRAVEEFAGILPEKYNMEMVYLDLVYTKNSNAVVAASNPVTLYWPYPQGTDQNTQFFVVHYEGLNRNDEQALTDHCILTLFAPQNQDPYKLENTPQGIRITVDSFSPFALFWVKADTTGSQPPKEESSQGGTAQTTPVVQTASLPQTGDTGLAKVWSGFCALSLVGLAVAVKLGRGTSRKQKDR